MDSLQVYHSPDGFRLEGRVLFSGGGMNTILFRTRQNEPGNEKLIRGLQSLNDSSDRLIDAHKQMIQAGQRYINMVRSD